MYMAIKKHVMYTRELHDTEEEDIFKYVILQNMFVNGLGIFIGFD